MEQLPETSSQGEPCPPSFEQALDELELIVHHLEEGEIGLAAALDHYEKGIRLLKQCYDLLERAERRIEVLCGVDAAGNPVTEPFGDDGAMSLDEKSQSRGRRRARPEAKAPSRDRSNSAEFPQVRVDEPGSLF